MNRRTQNLEPSTPEDNIDSITRINRRRNRLAASLVGVLTLTAGAVVVYMDEKLEDGEMTRAITHQTYDRAKEVVHDVAQWVVDHTEHTN
jgi:hypothetical protein